MKLEKLANKLITITVLLGAMTGVVACSKEKQSNDGVVTEDSLALPTESFLDSLDELADDVDTEASATSAGSVSPAVTICSVAALQPCNAGVRSIDYDSCRMLARPVSVVGGVDLSYSNPACSFGVGESLNRTYQLTYTSAFGQVEVSSADHQDYRGTTIGGGGVLERTDTGWILDLQGQRRIHRGPLGRELIDVSLRTTNPLMIEGTLRRSNRKVASGEFEINHNKARFTTTYSVKNLTYNSTCCYPVSGELNISHSGAVKGQGKIEFLQCGKGRFTSAEGNVKDLSFNSCEFK